MRSILREKAGPSLFAPAVLALAVLSACNDGSSREAQDPDAMSGVVDGGPDAGADIIPDAGAVPVSDAGQDAERPSINDDAAMADAGMSDAGDPVSMFCGDAIRDPVTEECDDGPGEALDVCTPDCRVSEAWVVDDTSVARRWGGGPHVLASTRRKVGAVYVTDSGGPSVWLSMFNAQGSAGQTPIELSAMTQPTAQANPCLATLPSGDFVVAWTDIVSASPDIVMSKVTDVGSITEPTLLHTGASGPQQDVDLIWTGSELVAAWTDTTDIKVRRFGADLIPKASDEVLANTDALESGVALAAFAGGYAAAFRVGTGATETIRVVAGDLTWQVSPGFLPGPTGDRPALTALDGEHLLLVFAEGTEPSGSGQGIVPRLRQVVLSASETGDVAADPVIMVTEPYASNESLAQRHPRVATVSTTVSLLWQQESEPGSSLGSEVLRLVWRWGAQQELLSVEREERVHADSEGDQTSPALGISPLFPGGALLMGFQQDPAPDPRSSPDLRWTLRPVPWVDLARRL